MNAWFANLEFAKSWKLMNVDIKEQHVQDFIKNDPVHGPRYAKVRQAGVLVDVGAVLGGFGGAGFSMVKTRSPIGAIVGFAAGALVGFMASDTVFSYTHGLYKFNVHETNNKLLQYARDHQ